MFWATVWMNYFFALVFIIGFGALALVAKNPAYVNAGGGLIGGGNMAAIHLSHAVGGDLMLGFISAVAFATILAVVAGLTLAGATAVSHDLYASVFRRDGASDASEVRVSRYATVVLGIVAIGLGIAFQNQNVAYMVSLAFSIACSSTLPLLILVLYWPRLTTRGAVTGGCVGLGTALLFTILGRPVWVGVLGYAAPIFPIDPPTIVTMPLAFLVCYVVSVDGQESAGRDRSPAGRRGWPCGTDGLRSCGMTLPRIPSCFKLISATPSPYARKVRIALAEKGIPFELQTEVPWHGTFRDAAIQSAREAARSNP